MDLQEFASKKYELYCHKEGSELIASEFALYIILQLISSFNTKKILELGVGIGTIADTVLSFEGQLNYTGTEANDFCRKAIATNLAHIKDNFTLLYDIDEIGENELFDLIIVDGTDNSLSIVKQYISKNGIVFIEGDRSSQVAIIKNIFPKQLSVFIPGDFKFRQYGGTDQATWERWVGGGTVFFVNPTLRQRLFWIRQKLRARSVFSKRKEN
ncbi:class I SAM-dependent methyltransferase [Hyunsoonleella rubra]|uniref:Class I SAM-dependent methyltransferase n=1 Tax=Hyunsoonleella rubra TaxID=1737062 RepID=A0ABW5TB03_9FLAO